LVSSRRPPAGKLAMGVMLAEGWPMGQGLLVAAPSVSMVWPVARRSWDPSVRGGRLHCTVATPEVAPVPLAAATAAVAAATAVGVAVRRAPRRRWFRGAAGKARVVRRARECGSYSFEEAGRFNEEVRIYIPLRDEHSASDVEFELVNGTIRVGLKGETPAVHGKLRRPVELEDCDWMIDDHEGQRSIVVTLTKVNVRLGWDHLLEHEAAATPVVEDDLPGEADNFSQPMSNKEDLAALDQLERVQALLRESFDVRLSFGRTG